MRATPRRGDSLPRAEGIVRTMRASRDASYANRARLNDDLLINRRGREGEGEGGKGTMDLFGTGSEEPAPTEGNFASPDLQSAGSAWGNQEQSLAGRANGRTPCFSPIKRRRRTES